MSHNLARTVLFNVKPGVVRPAIVTRVLDEKKGCCSLTVFCDPDVDGVAIMHVTAEPAKDDKDCTHTFSESGKDKLVCDGVHNPPAAAPHAAHGVHPSHPQGYSDRPPQYNPQQGWPQHPQQAAPGPDYPAQPTNVEQPNE